MLIRYIKFLSLATFIALSGNVFTQQNIPINDSLEAHAEILEITKGYSSEEKIKKIHFGEYIMHSYEFMDTRSRNKDSFFGTTSSSESLSTASFTLSNSTHDTVQVMMSHQILEKKKDNSVAGFQFGEKKLLNSDLFTSLITINRDTTEKWTLIFEKSSGHEIGYKQAAYLTNDVRTIDIKLVRGTERGKNISRLPAMGYEFVEGGKSIGAIETFNGKLFQASITGWIDNRLDVKTKLLLATAMMSILYKPGGE